MSPSRGPFLKRMAALGAFLVIALGFAGLRAQAVCEEFLQASGNPLYASLSSCLGELSGLSASWREVREFGEVRVRSADVKPSVSPVVAPVLPPDVPVPTQWSCVRDEECRLTGCCGGGAPVLTENYRLPEECKSLKCVPSPHRAVCMQGICAKWVRPEEVIRGAACGPKNCAACMREDCERLSEHCEVASEPVAPDEKSRDQASTYSCRPRA